MRGGRSRTSLLVALAVGCGLLLAPHGGAVAAEDAQTNLRLVTFDGPGTAGHRGPRPEADYRTRLQRRQDEALTAVDAPTPVYRWTTALSGVAVELTDDQATELGEQPGVTTVEDDIVRPVAGVATRPRGTPREPRGRGGAGVVIGVVDTGIWPENPLFADSPAVGHRPGRFAGSCPPGEDWAAGTCNAKLVAARMFVDGFGEDRLAADEPLSPRDVRGHGTEVASIAAGNSGVSVGVPGLPADYSGVAPRARVAAYKACWSAPDPDDDGCSSADLVSAIDAATRDRVDVLNLAVTGGAGIGTVERALLGAAEAGITVVAAAGNAGETGYATHVSPWVTTVGALTNPRHTGSVALGDGRRLTGVMTTRRTVSAPGVAARDIPAAGHSVSEAAQCVPGSLDAARADGRVVVCERGSVARVTKSAAVQRADGVGMVLVNTHRGSLGHDLHAVPTVHLGRQAGQVLLDWLGEHPREDVVLARRPSDRPRARVAPWSPDGDPTGATLKPDLVAPGTGLLAGLPPTVTGRRWAYLSGTSAATAWASGTAATLLARHDWSPPVVRSVLAESARPGPDSVLRAGAGRPRPAVAGRLRLAHDVDPGAYRAWLAGRRDTVNSPSLLFRGQGAEQRRVTNIGGRTETWRVEVRGFDRHDVTVSPTTVTLRPGASATYRVTVGGGSVVGGLDEGALTWVAGDGSRVRVPVAIGR